MQETLLAIHLKRGTWDPRRRLGPWVAAIARHKLVDAIRRRNGRIEISIESLADGPAAPPPERSATESEVNLLVDALSPRQRDVVHAVSLEGLSIRAAAERLRMNESAVRVALHRALKALARRMRTGGP